MIWELFAIALWDHMVLKQLNPKDSDTAAKRAWLFEVSLELLGLYGSSCCHEFPLLGVHSPILVVRNFSCSRALLLLLSIVPFSWQSKEGDNSYGQKLRQQTCEL
ncbi:hypothetical protein O6P43_032686 [Quillaja saponaria]|uniref:Uncharacterized protein n=1 Tax=Quillaja saponaria TaxID=32244 RepID=A0AAD7P5J1_QUISA|nr:hypothetical protein O6P43_032686 [Quillaja saponaria]